MVTDNEPNSLRDRVAQIIGSIPPRVLDLMSDDEILVVKCAATIVLGDHANEATREAFASCQALVAKRFCVDVPTEKAMPAAEVAR